MHHIGKERPGISPKDNNFPQWQMALIPLYHAMIYQTPQMFGVLSSSQNYEGHLFKKEQSMRSTMVNPLCFGWAGGWVRGHIGVCYSLLLSICVHPFIFVIIDGRTVKSWPLRFTHALGSIEAWGSEDPSLLYVRFQLKTIYNDRKLYILLRDIVVCLRALQAIKLGSKNTAYPLVDRRSSGRPA
jgi:hypothetical protein